METTSTEYPGPDWNYYCRCPKRYRIENSARPGHCYRCTLELPSDHE